MQNTFLGSCVRAENARKKPINLWPFFSFTTSRLLKNLFLAVVITTSRFLQRPTRGALTGLKWTTTHTGCQFKYRHYCESLSCHHRLFCYAKPLSLSLPSTKDSWSTGWSNIVCSLMDALTMVSELFWHSVMPNCLYGHGKNKDCDNKKTCFDYHFSAIMSWQLSIWKSFN